MKQFKMALFIGLPLVALILFGACKNNGIDTDLITVDFWAQRMDNYEWYQVTAVQMYEGDYSIIYVDEEAPVEVTAATAQAISYEFDYQIYPLITTKFGEASDQDQDGKITILILDIWDGGSEDSYVAGYFDATHELSSESYPKSNERDMLFMDCNPGIPGNDQFYMTIAHELQHLVNFNREYLSDEDGNGSPDGELQDTWINEGLSSAAEYLYNGEQISLKVDVYNNSAYGARADIKEGVNFLQWSNALANYSTVYLFFQWLRIHADASVGDGIYKQILDHVADDYTAVEDIANDNALFSSHDWHMLLRDWFVANQLNQSTGVYGYGGDPVLNVNPPYHDSGGTLDLNPGEGVYVNLGSEQTVSATPFGSIDYAGITPSTGPYVDFTGGDDYSAEIFLSYNFNGDINGTQESATMPSVSMLPTGGSSSSSRSLSSVPSHSQPIQAVPIGVIFNPDGTSSWDSSKE